MLHHFADFVLIRKFWDREVHSDLPSFPFFVVKSVNGLLSYLSAFKFNEPESSVLVACRILFFRHTGFNDPSVHLEFVFQVFIKKVKLDISNYDLSRFGL